MLNPKSPLPLTIRGVDRAGAQAIKERLDGNLSLGIRDNAEGLLPIVSRSNLQCKELDDYVAKFKPQYEATIETLKRTSSEWSSASEKDREDLLSGFRQEAIAALDVRPYCDLEVLFNAVPNDATIDDALLDKYGYDSLHVYLRYAGNLDKVRTVPAESLERKKFEKLVELGLAIRGADIPLAAILESLPLKELNMLAAGTTEKEFRRKSQASEHISKLADIKDRLGKTVAFRELFQLKPLSQEFSQTNLNAISIAQRYAREIAGLVAHTYVMGAYSVRDMNQGDMSFIKGWEILGADGCPFCQRAAKQKYSKRRRPFVPLHIGCRCSVMPTL